MSLWVDPEVLILEVESRPLLYAKTLPEYSNKIMKNNTWEIITKKLSEDWETLNNDERNSRCKDIQTKWKHLRDNFRREYQAQKNVTSGQGAKKRKKYRYYDQLLFLVPFIKDANTSGNYSTTNVSQTNVFEQNPESSSTSTATANVSETSKKKKKTKSSFEDEVLKAINKENMSEMDEDKTFCLSLVQSLKKMDDDNKILAKIEILNVIRTFSNRPNIEQSNPNLSLQLTPIYTQATQQQYSQPTFTQTRDMYQQHSQAGTTFIYTQTPQQQQYSQATFPQARDMYQQQSESNPTPTLLNPVNSSKQIKVLENRLLTAERSANSTAQSSRPQSAQSFFTAFNPNICPSPSNTDLSSSTTVINISSPEHFCMSPDDC